MSPARSIQQPSGELHTVTPGQAKRRRRLLARIIGDNAFTTLRNFRRLARNDWRSPFPMQVKFNAWRRGFKAESFVLFDLAHNDPNDYISEYQRWHQCVNINASLPYFTHKIEFRSILLSAGLSQPETVALCAKGQILLRPLEDTREYVSASQLEAVLSEEEGARFIVKPENGTRGEGIFLVINESGRLLRQRGDERVPFDVGDLPGNTLIESMVRQGAFWNALFPHTGNTMRILTGFTEEETEPVILRAVQRIGTADTIPTDNWSGGAICSRIDLQTGRLGPGLTDLSKSRHRGRALAVHPDSGAQIEGAIVPHWETICRTARRAAACSPLHRYVGWDILVDERGTPIILEGNGNTGVAILQVHGGLLADPNVRRFYKRAGVL